jgi:hypothetical protein
VYEQAESRNEYRIIIIIIIKKKCKGERGSPEE